MWYVLQVPTGREDRLIEEIRSYRIQEYFEEVFAPRSVRKKKYRGKWQTSEELLFPGYLFVISENPEELYQALKRIPRMTRILGTGEKWPAMTANDIETVRRLAALRPAAPDFRIIWDNAYCVHDIYSEEKLANIFEFGQRYGTEDRILCFTSTSKITFPGSGVAAMALSPANMAQAKKLIGIQTISFDKLNQLRHVRYLQNAAHVHEIMQRHADIIRPKFDIVFEALEAELGGLGIASWTKPNGGYFISLTLMDGCAKRVWSLMRQAGVVLTGAGATYPYGKDPRDANLRLAPTYSPAHELEVCIQALSACVRLASLEKMLAE